MTRAQADHPSGISHIDLTSLFPFLPNMTVAFRFSRTATSKSIDCEPFSAASRTRTPFPLMQFNTCQPGLESVRMSFVLCGAGCNRLEMGWIFGYPWPMEPLFFLHKSCT